MLEHGIDKYVQLIFIRFENNSNMFNMSSNPKSKIDHDVCLIDHCGVVLANWDCFKFSVPFNYYREKILPVHLNISQIYRLKFVEWLYIFVLKSSNKWVATFHPTPPRGAESSLTVAHPGLTYNISIIMQSRVRPTFSTISLLDSANFPCFN